MSVVKINEEKCIGCSFCVNDCPGACLYLDNDKAHVHDSGFFITCTRLSRRLRKVIYTPGHTTDSVVFYSEKDSVAFVGDTIFKGSIGNYQYPGGNAVDLQRSIINKIFSLPDDTILYSGHSEQTTAGREKRRYRY